MSGLSNAHHFRKLVAGCCMVLAPLALLIAMVDDSTIGTSRFSLVIGRVGNPDTGELSQVLLVASLVLFVPVVLGLMHMLREREVEIGHLGGAVALLGLLVLPYAFCAGIAVLAVGLYRAHVVHEWVAFCVFAAAVVLGLAGTSIESETMAFIGTGLMFIGLGTVGRTVIAESDEAWEHTPEIRPMTG
jgi:hypothetical protein